MTHEIVPQYPAVLQVLTDIDNHLEELLEILAEMRESLAALEESQV